MKYVRIITLATSFLVPLLATAQGAFEDVIETLEDSIDIVIIFLFLVATVVFLWGVVRYISAGGDEEKTKEARQMIIWGVIFLAVMVAVWGFVNIVLDFIFGVETSPAIPGPGDVPKQ